jgi:hypothetical protein
LDRFTPHGAQIHIGGNILLHQVSGNGTKKNVTSKDVIKFIKNVFIDLVFQLHLRCSCNIAGLKPR